MTEQELLAKYPWIDPVNDLLDPQTLLPTEKARRAVALELMPFAPDGRRWQ